MNEVMIFNNPEFGQVRTVTIDGEPWFVGKDVADALGYENSRKALIDHVDDEDKNTVTIRDGNRGNPNQTVINESGLYALIFGSRLASAIKFKRWVTSEVLPSIRKTGSYNATSNQIPYDKYLEAAKIVRGCKDREERNLIIGILQSGGFNIPVVDVVSIDTKKIDKVEFSEDFRKFLKDNGYSYKTFGEVSGLAKSTIHNYATGKTVADEKNMKILEQHGFGKQEEVVENDSIYDRIVELCDEMGISQRQLQKAVGISVGALSKWKTSAPRIDTLQAIADYFHVDMDYLLGSKPRMRCVGQKQRKVGEKIMAKKKSEWEKKVRHALLDRDMDIPELAAEVGFNVTYLYDVFSGARPGEKVKAAINEYLNIEGD